MSAEQIKTVLQQLHSDLGATQTVDPELRALLVKLDGDIQQLLQQAEPNAVEAEGVIGRVEEAATNFSIRHPQVAGLLRQLADGLGQMGI
ncbi:MAG TPA: DUF4404 family protein [Pirellulales bacterium]|nr:DUF4404 family protein [Pirellulales bacterium]